MGSVLTQSFWGSGVNAYGDVLDGVANDLREALRIWDDMVRPETSAI